MAPMIEPLRIGSLFSGIGGLELGLEWAGVGRTTWQVEIDPFCRAVLAKHWPDAVRFEDVRSVGRANLPPVDVVCGGFPCQDLSYAGKGAGLSAERSGLFWEYMRVVRELRPRFVVVENVAALLTRGLGVVLGTLADLGFDAEWSCIQAPDVGAPHKRRDRLFVIAMANADRRRRESKRRGRVLDGERATRGGDAHGCSGAPMGDADGARRQGPDGPQGSETVGGSASGPARNYDAHGAESGLGRVSHGIPDRVDRWPALDGEQQHEWEPPRTAAGVASRGRKLRALGNAVVPQVAEVVGRRLVEIAKVGS